MSERSYTPVKGVGDGSFGTVWLCDWHTPLPPSVTLAPMQQGAGAKPEWQGKRLVAIKRMKQRWEGGWDEARRHPELEVGTFCLNYLMSGLAHKRFFVLLMLYFFLVATKHTTTRECHSALRLFLTPLLQRTLFRV